MVGYTESLTDPSYQILVLTYPLIGNYGVPKRLKLDLEHIPDDFESSRIHVAALIVGNYSEEFSHFLAASSLGAWLKESDVPAIYGVDTRALTKRIHDKGSLLGRVLARKQRLEDRARATSLPTPQVSRFPSPALVNSWKEDYDVIPFADPNVENLVAQVSTPTTHTYKPTGTNVRHHPITNQPLRVLIVDVGMKYNQIRCFTKRGVELRVVP